LRQADTDAADVAIQALPLIDEIRLTYDETGNLSSETATIHRLQQESGWEPLRNPRTTTVEHEHDELGNTTATTLPGGQKLNYLYYGSGHLHQINIDGQVISDIERDPLHREIQRTQGSIDTQWQLDPMGRTLRHCRGNCPGCVFLESSNGSRAPIVHLTRHGRAAIAAACSFTELRIVPALAAVM
jgi:YD repeat-containing protein